MAMAATSFLSFADSPAKFEFSASEARVLDAEPQTFVKPLVVEVKIDESKGRIRDSWTLNVDEYNSRVIKGDYAATIRNLQVYGVFKSSEKHNCDIIATPTFDVQINERGAVINVVGFPASFVNWTTGTKADVEWLSPLQMSPEVYNKGVSDITVGK